MNTTGQLTLVGAGPGDPELISVKGIKALNKADVVLYDALVDTELLEHAPSRAKRVFVGKRVGRARYAQDEINRLIVKYALPGNHVVRLKGGDPFVFGRGHEELEYAEAFGIDVKVVPGISSVTAVPALQGIPITKRGVSESYWVITGTTKSGALSKDIALAAQSSATVVILMGTRKLNQIVNIFSSHGRDETPIAIIQNGSTPKEKIALGTVDTIVDIARKKRVDAPAIILIGEVAGLHSEFNYELVEKSNNEIVNYNR